jgi:hypothetical protein
MPKPTMATQIGKMANAKRCRDLSEKYAMIMANAKAHAHGGTEWSWVWIAL